MAINIITDKVIKLEYNVQFKIKLKAKGGTKPYKWSTKSTLPNKIRLTSKGALKGTPKEVGEFKKIKIKVVDDNGESATKRFKIIVKSNLPNTTTTTTTTTTTAAPTTTTTTTTTTAAPTTTTTTTTAAPLGGLWLWGKNTYGQLGDNTTTSKSSPIQTIAYGNDWKQLSVNENGSAGIKNDGTLWMWGFYAILGNNSVSNSSSPVQTICGGTNWEKVSCNSSNAAAIKTDGTLWLWGGNAQGQIGDNTTTTRLSPVQTVSGGTNWKDVACGGGFTIATKTDGTLWCWGYNDIGELGDNTLIKKSSPVQTIAGGTNWNLVSCGLNGSFAIKNDGTLWGWGENIFGELGDNTNGRKSSPVQTIARGTNWISVKAGPDHTIGLKSDGTLWCWGNNFNGTLGNNAGGVGTNKSSPVQTIAGGTNWIQISTGWTTSYGLKNDGSLWSWGGNSYGELGDNTIINRSSPVQVIISGWSKINGNYGNHMGGII